MYLTRRIPHASVVDASMRILFTSTSYPADPGDWQGLFIARMLEGLSGRPDLALEAWCPPGTLPDGVASSLREDDDAWFRQLASRGGIAHLLRKHPVQGMATSVQLIKRLRRVCLDSRPDLFHVNWLQCALGLPSNQIPALVTALGTDMQLLRIPMMRQLLAGAFRQRRVALCPNADWMVPVLERSFGPDVLVRCVPFGIDRAWYQTTRTFDASPPHRWICVSRLTDGKIGPLFEWAEALFRAQGRELHLIGPHQDKSIRIPDWVKYHGSASPEQLRSEWFPRATGLVSMSVHPEGRPQVMLEAMAAGLPILASSNPAHEDLVTHQLTGWVCNDVADFEAGLTFIEDSGNNREMGDRARADARKRFGDWDDCAARYACLYEELLA